MRYFVLCFAVLSVLLFSCAGIQIAPPPGFAAYIFDDRFEAVSPEGMRYRVRFLENSPPQSLDYWSEALSTHLRKEGYRQFGQVESFKAAGKDGLILEWVLPYAHESYIYMTALVVSDSVLAVIESAAEQSVYRRHREAVISSLSGLDLKDVKPAPVEAYAPAMLPDYGVAKTTASFSKPQTSSGGGCFPAGTVVFTSAGPVSIERVAEGSLVWASDPDRGTWELKEAVRLLSHTYSGDMITITTGGGTVRATGNHPFWVVRGTGLESRPEAADVPSTDRGNGVYGRWVEARSLRRGDELRTRNGNTTVNGVTTEITDTTVYNLTVTGYHTYSVGTAGFLVHNKGAAESSASAGYTTAAPEPTAAPGMGKTAASAPRGTTGATETSMPVDGQEPGDARKRVYSGACDLVVDDITETKKAISLLAEETGGYVEAIYERTVVIRVPAESFDPVFEKVLAQGDILNKRVETYDVTEYYVDMKVRLELAEKARDRLYVLLEKTEDVKERLKILQEIGRLTEEIENRKSALATLEQQIAFSRITANLNLRSAPVLQDKLNIPFGWIARLEPLYPSTQGAAENISLSLGDDFAVFDDQALFRAEGAEGTRVRLGTVRNVPRGDGVFWQQALIHHLGPFYAESNPVEAGEFYGALFTSKDRNPFLYFVAVLDRGDAEELAAFEAFFPDEAAYERRMDSLTLALKDAEVKQ